jgi:hypothetical protein
VSEEVTKEQDGSFEKRVFLALDSLVRTYTAPESRFTTLELPLDKQALETKPMRERQSLKSSKSVTR